jgi:protease-4
MKQFFKIFFASLLAMIVMGFIFFGFIIAGIIGLSKSVVDKAEKKTDGNVLVIDLAKTIHEQGATNSFAFLDKSSAYQAGIYDIMKGISAAKTDANIKGILIKAAPSPNGWATLQQLRMALQDFKASGKFIYAYGEDITQGAYFASSVSDSIYLNPAGGIDLKGFATVLAFFKGTLEKLEVQPEIFYAGKFKSATEPFRADKISDPNRLQIQAFQNGMWNEFLAAAAQYTHADKATINDWAVNGTIQFPGDALKHNMVAGLLYWDEVEKRIKAKTGQKESEEIKYVSINDYSTNAKEGKEEDKVSNNRIAVIFADGDIVDGEQNNDREIASRTICEQIRKVAKNDKIKAVVLRVNSPGGSALASDVILRELVLLKQKKHLIVSMGDYAASGGYYISSMADSIFALPNTITGSIGVFSMLYSTDKLMKDKLGVTFDEVKNAPYADIPTTARPLTALEGQRMQNEVDTIYALFKGHVAEGRKLSLADVDSIAQGRVWTGTDAKDKGLVDALGGLDRAIASAVAMAKVKDYKVVTYPEPDDKLNSLMRKFHMNMSASAMVKESIKEQTGEAYEWYEQLQSLSKMNNKAMMAMPFVMKVK